MNCAVQPPSYPLQRSLTSEVYPGRAFKASSWEGHVEEAIPPGHALLSVYVWQKLARIGCEM